jgi:hypothetical protein
VVLFRVAPEHLQGGMMVRVLGCVITHTQHEYHPQKDKPRMRGVHGLRFLKDQ